MLTDAAFVVFQVKVLEDPACIELGFAVNVPVGGGMTVTVTVLGVASPPGPVTDNVYVVVAVGVTVLVPFAATAPIPWFILIDVALVVLHDKVLDEPKLMAAGLAVKVEVGTTFTVTVRVIVPPAPVTVIVYVVLIDGETPIEPFRAVLPIAGLKLTDVAFTVLQFKVLVPLGLIVDGFAVNAACGTMLIVTDCVVVPPAPIAVIVYVVFDVGETEIEPFVATYPIPWFILIDVALVVLHDKVLDEP